MYFSFVDGLGRCPYSFHFFSSCPIFFRRLYISLLLKSDAVESFFFFGGDGLAMSSSSGHSFLFEWSSLPYIAHSSLLRVAISPFAVSLARIALVQNNSSIPKLDSCRAFTDSIFFFPGVGVRINKSTRNVGGGGGLSTLIFETNGVDGVRHLPNCTFSVD